MIPAKMSRTSSSVATASAETITSMIVLVFLLVPSLLSLVGISRDLRSAVTTGL